MKKMIDMKNLFLFTSLCLASSFVFASQTTKIIGGTNGWGELQEQVGVTTGKGYYGYEAIQLVTSTQESTDATDLLLTFDGKQIKDSTGHYTIKTNNLVYSPDAVKGRGAALSRGVHRGLSLEGGSSAIFGKPGLTGSFTIEFWMNPSIAENGETVISWRSSINSDGESKYQNISASFFNNHLRWEFNNIFSKYETDEIIMDGISTLIPRKWTRHTLSFDDTSGLLEYCVDGRTEALKYITTSKHENGTVCYPVLGVKADLEICPEFSGRIDNFRIDHRPFHLESKNLYATGNEKYKVDGGKITTNPIMVSRAAALNRIDALMDVPPQTEVRFYVRSGDNCYGWSDTFPAWKEVVSGQEISGVTGLYFQLSAELLPDGGGAKTPVLSEIKMKYTEQDDPLPPFTVNAEPGNECVTISWSYSVDDTAGGYYVYYGNKSGEYLGVAAVEGASPVKVGNKTSIKLTGLKNGTIYYFAVSAYSKVDGRISGNLSKEVYARPSARLKK